MNNSIDIKIQLLQFRNAYFSIEKNRSEEDDI